MSFKTEVLNVLGDLTSDAEHVSVNILAAPNATSIVENALWDLANLLPPETLLKVSEERTADDETILLEKETRVLFIQRRDDSTGGTLYFPCKEIPYHQHQKSIDPDSIYHATNQSPVWYITGNTSNSTQNFGDISVYPGSATTKVWWYQKQTVKNCTTDTTVDAPTADSNGHFFWDGAADATATLGDPAVAYYNYALPHFFPREAIYALQLLCASRLVNQYLADAALSEEDGEIIGLSKASLDAIDVEFKIQLDRLGVKKGDGK